LEEQVIRHGGVTGSSPVCVTNDLADFWAATFRYRWTKKKSSLPGSEP